jgi:hypothetical protein
MHSITVLVHSSYLTIETEASDIRLIWVVWYSPCHQGNQSDYDNQDSLGIPTQSYTQKHT